MTAHDHLRLRGFEEIRHIDGISPAWPLIYDDFEPWHTRAEHLYQVHDNADEDPTPKGHRSGPHDSLAQPGVASSQRG